jgi:uncharacterized protein
MHNTLADVEPLVYKSQINVPYNWWAGDTASRFLIALRDEKKILGTRCARCERVYVPPRKVCPTCFTENPDWVQVSDEGALLTYTVARRQLAALPEKVPVAFGLVKLDGADTALLHYLREVGEDEFRIGMRVKAEFAASRSGTILDIAYFKPVK